MTDFINTSQLDSASGQDSKQKSTSNAAHNYVKYSDIVAPQEHVMAFSGTINGKTLNDAYKIPDVQNYSSFTILLTFTQTAATGDGRIAVRGYIDALQTIFTPDLACIDLASTTPATRVVTNAVTAGATTASIILQVTPAELYALEIYTKTADTGTAVSVAVKVIAKGGH